MSTSGAPPPPPSGMPAADIADYLDREIGGHGGSDFARTIQPTLLSYLLTAKGGSVAISSDVWAPFASTVFWQAFLYSDEMEDILSEAGVQLGRPERQVFVVMHGQGRWPRHDLIVFDASYGGV